MHTKRIFCVLLFHLLVSSAVAQDWKTVYDQAVAAYQSEQYGEALTNAKKAFVLSKSLEVVNQAYSAQLITAICVADNQADEGLKVIEEEIALYGKAEGENSKTSAEAWRKYVTLLQIKGALKDAEAKCEKGVLVTKAAEGENSLAYLTLRSRLGQLAAANGNLAKAKATLDACLPLFSKFPDSGEDFITALLVSADVDKALQDFPTAEKKYKQLLAIYEQNNLQQTEEYGAIKKSLAEILLARNEKTESATLLEGSSASPELKVRQLLLSALDFQGRNELQKAIEQYQKATQTIQADKLESNTSFSVYLNYGRLLLDQENLAEAEKQITLADAQAKKLFTPESPEAGFIQFAQGDLALAKGNLTSAISTYKTVSGAASTLSSAPHLRLLQNATKKLLNLNQTVSALELLKPVVSNQKALTLLPAKDQEQVILLYCQALTQSGQHDQAIAQLNEALKVAASENSKFIFTLELSEALRSKGEWAQARQLLINYNSGSLPEESKAQLFYHLAKLQQLLGSFAEAEKNYRSAIEWFTKISKQHSEEVMPVYNSMAIFYTQLGNYEQAERLYLDLLKQANPASELYNTVQQNLAAVYEETLRYAEAEKLLEKVAEQDKKRLGENHPDYAITLQNLATVYKKTGNAAKAKEFYSKALDIDRKTLGEQNLNYATKAANLAVVLQDLNELPQAKVLLESALKTREVKLGKEHPDYVFNEYTLAVLYQRMGDLPKALPLFRHVSGFYVRQINELFPAMSEKEKTAYVNKINEVILAYLDFAVENAGTYKELLGDLFNFRISTKALLLNSSSKVRNRILASGDPAVMSQFAAWIQTKEELAKLYALTQEERQLNKAKIEALQNKANETEKWLSSQSELFAKSIEQEPVTWQKIKSKLKPGEAAMEIIRVRLNTKNDSIIYAALVIKPESTEPSLVILPNGKKIEGREFSFYRNSLRFEMSNERSFGIYWKTLQGQLNGIKKIVISPDGVFNKINLLSLYNPESKQYLIDQVSIELLSNLGELISAPAAQAPLRTASLFGSPDFKLGKLPANTSGNDIYSFIGRDFPELPATKEEITKIGGQLKTNQWTLQTYLLAEATEKNIKAQKSPGVLHIATHGFFIPTSEDEDPIVHSQNPDPSANNPLLRSGVILSGAGRIQETPEKNSEDGILTAYEAMNLNLDKTQLVVLSACETGAGEVRNGEGVYGLQRAFILAGAGNLLMSLWKVDDEATQELMVEFYNQWNKTNNKSTAFRNAQLEIKKRREAPYFWGSFVMIGTD